MKGSLYLRLARQNIIKNYRFFIPRILAEAGLLGCFYIALTLAMDERIGRTKGGEFLPSLMGIGAAVLAILSVILLWYTNSFLMKQRRREFGLYNVLGMEKRHVGRVLTYENMLAGTAGVLLGLGLGVLFYKLCSLLICRLLKTDVIIGFYFITPRTLLPAGGFFLLLDLFLTVLGRCSVRRMKPVELLGSRSAGEKEPRVKWLLLIPGLIMLGAGYWISIVTKSPLEALERFFLAVLLVIAGTYLLFVSLSTFVLKALRRNRAFYYDRRRMPAVAGLLWRMKQNAVGLASIAILATGVLVMISTTVSLYAGIERVIAANYPEDLYASAVVYDGDGGREAVSAGQIGDVIRAAADRCGLGLKSVREQKYLELTCLMEGNTLRAEAEIDRSMFSSAATVRLITAETCRAFTGREADLREDEILFFRLSDDPDTLSDLSQGIEICGTRFLAREVSEPFPFTAMMSTGSPHRYGFVVSGDEVLEKIYRVQKEEYGPNASEITDLAAAVFEDTGAAARQGAVFGEAFSEGMQDLMAGTGPDESEWGYMFDTAWGARAQLTGMYGTLLFLGILLGLVCLFATVLIIYFKQISEGYEDRDRFRIMEKIGMSRKEVRQTINKQVLMVFFLPLIVAGIHLLFASPILLRMLRLLLLTETSLFVLCALVTYGVFALVYTVIYIGTSKTYYNIIV